MRIFITSGLIYMVAVSAAADRFDGQAPVKLHCKSLFFDQKEETHEGYLY